MIGPRHISASSIRAVQARWTAYLEDKYPGTRWRPVSDLDERGTDAAGRPFRRARLVAGTADDKSDDDR